MKKIKIVVDVSTESEKWFCENDGYIQSNLAIDIVKGCIKSVLGPYPKFLVLPQGVFQLKDSGFHFVKNQRHVIYVELTETEYKIYNGLSFISTIDKIVKCIKLYWIRFKMLFNNKTYSPNLKNDFSEEL